MNAMLLMLDMSQSSVKSAGKWEKKLNIQFPRKNSYTATITTTITTTTTTTTNNTNTTTTTTTTN